MRGVDLIFPSLAVYVSTTSPVRVIWPVVDPRIPNTNCGSAVFDKAFDRLTHVSQSTRDILREELQGRPHFSRKNLQQIRLFVPLERRTAAELRAVFERSALTIDGAACTSFQDVYQAFEEAYAFADSCIYVSKLSMTGGYGNANAVVLRQALCKLVI